MILEEKEINRNRLKKIIGEPVKVDFNKLLPIGTTSFFLKSFNGESNFNNTLKINSRCNFQLYEKGILLRSNFSNRLAALPIRFNEIAEIKLVRGKEFINPFPFSPMWILLKLGVSILHARHFNIFLLTEYRIEEMTLLKETIDFKLKLTGNGYAFERQKAFFENLNSHEKIIIDLNKTE